MAHSENIFSEPANIDPHTLRNLGPLSQMAGIFEGSRGTDRHPEADGPMEEPYVERYELQPLDPQTNGPQLLYGLRYHVHITRPGDTGTFHDQVGYWLWEPATGSVLHTLSIPRGLVAMAAGTAPRDAKQFELKSELGSQHFGICSNPFLDRAFKTVSFRIEVKILGNGTWSYEQDTVLQIAGRPDLFHHTDKNTLRKIAEPTPNPRARAAGGS